jgi:hypothetical protein
MANANGSHAASTAPDPSDVIKILVATDIHLGYGEKHPVKAEDSFITFDEILKIGVDEGESNNNLMNNNKERSLIEKICFPILTL